jgi:regulator of protease activity HflC (stomatin/prohibitin superfamily)
LVLDNLVDAILSNIAELMPFVIVQSYEEGVRQTVGKNPKKLSPGFHWRIWLLHQVTVLPVVDDVLMLPTQSVITKDGKLVCFKGSIGYRVRDIVKHVCNVVDFSESTTARAMQHLAKKVRDKELAELIADLTPLEKSLEGTLETKLKDWGTEVFSVGFTDFAEVPTQVRLFQDIPLAPKP